MGIKKEHTGQRYTVGCTGSNFPMTSTSFPAWCYYVEDAVAELIKNYSELGINLDYTSSKSPASSP